MVLVVVMHWGGGGGGLIEGGGGGVHTCGAVVWCVAWVRLGQTHLAWWW